MNLWIEMGKMLAQSFEKDNVSFMKALPMCDVPKKALLGCYNIFLSNKMPRIEDLPDEQKASLKSLAIEISDNRLKKVEELIDLCRCLFALEYLLNL